MVEVKYAEYRDYLQKRQAANSSIMALLAGSKLAGHLLSLTAGSNMTLSEIFPKVDHIRSFNLKSQLATDILEDAEHHLGLMAVPYLLAIHEDYLKECLFLLSDAGLIRRRQARDAKAATIHMLFETHSSTALPVESIELYDLIRLMRNCVIHRGGTASEELAKAASTMSTSAATAWTKMTTQPPPAFAKLDRVRLGYSETVATLAVTKKIARAVNSGLAVCCPRDMWLERLVDDYEAHANIPTTADKRMRLARGISNFNYFPLQFKDVEIRAALKERGHL
ncbi:hypothetical protein EV382_4475 [Micromonospora violae]|uniref:Uncharacterized protein n=1 Tax=Micromonospora violae TaxID=1278207 RepID=A0A4Q7ULA7_9ACTN|nr:hypothetical protein [Micromonospora violae]RZT81201.1 hypothetical protein EV382_4475 [Micromonospora violae]